ncbi:MAG TPA: ArsC family transcriptional regulator [Clostridia bacterium]|nr:MAG: putative reductase [Firmicutes bacterium ADurb.Bin146]HOD93271.1 ArsC family transcriptional regulator [Clostridia bacterium]HQM39483.1 ArsC family transcriptional regulator [Clostridia bacterium]
MNIQIFGKSKCFDTKKAERFFKERKISFQYIDMLNKGMSKGELEKVIKGAGGIEKLLDLKAKDQDKLMQIKYAKEQDKFDMLLLNQHLVITPVVRNGNKVTVGYEIDIWKSWEDGK